MSEFEGVWLVSFHCRGNPPGSCFLFRKGRSRGYSETTVKIRLGKFMSREGSERVKDVIPLNENVLLCFGWWILTRRTKRIVKKIDRED